MAFQMKSTISCIFLLMASGLFPSAQALQSQDSGSQHFMAPTTGADARSASHLLEAVTSLAGWGDAGAQYLHSSLLSMAHAVEMEVLGDHEGPGSHDGHEIEMHSSNAEYLKPVPAGRKQMYFRPVSVTLQCVMTLTIASLVVYTLLSLGRNSDELSATFKPSLFTQTLTVASRVATVAPMMCMLFVGCRMYVLATTEGLGEPPMWVKNCMKTCVCGVFIQLLVVGLLPLNDVLRSKVKAEEEAAYSMTEGKQEAALAKKAEKDAAEKAAHQEEEGHPDDAPMMQDHAGEQNDAHPVLNKIEVHEQHAFMKYIFYILQVVSMACIYIGVFGVVFGIITFPAQSTKISAAVLCTVILSCLYFTVSLLLWIGRAIDTEKLTHAALAMTSVVRKAPMFSVLFLASRMRALQLDPPYGMPPFWMQCCFYSITALIYFEAGLGAVVGATGEMKKAYYGVYIFKCPSKALQISQHFCGIIQALLLFPIAYGVYAMEGTEASPFKPGEPAPLSTTLKCVLFFQCVYFGVNLIQVSVLFAEEVKDQEMPIIRDSAVAAGISLGMAPLLCILFVATRMRALQITQQQGAPPGWAQDCMYIAVFSTCLQAFCCLVMPIFIGSACQVDEDGNPDYDLKPMIGAYAVTTVKYVALIALHGSVITICVAVYAMTPETAHSGNRFIGSTKSLFEALFGTVLLFFVALLLSSAKVVGMAIKFAIEACDSTLLGVEITIKKVALNAFKGYVHISRLVLHQPEEEIIYKKDEHGKMTREMTGKKLEWNKDYIAKIDVVLVKIDLWRLITTFGKEFHLENLSLAGINFNVEKPDADIKNHNSNVEYITNYLDFLGLIPPPEDEAAAAKRKEQEKKDAEEQKKKDAEAKKNKKDEPKKEAPPLDIPKIIIGKIDIGDFGAGVCLKGVKFIGQLSFNVGIPKFCIDNVQQSVFHGREDLSPGESVACIIQAIAKKVFTSVANDIPKKVMEVTKAQAGKVAANVGGAVSGLGRKLTSGLSNMMHGSPKPKDKDPGSPTTPSAPQEGSNSNTPKSPSITKAVPAEDA